MADPNLPDINADLDALPFDEGVKEQLYNAFYAVDESQSKKILEGLQIPGKIKNDLYQKRYNAIYGTPKPPAATPQAPAEPQEGTWDKVKKNAPRSAANLVTGIMEAGSDPLGVKRGAKDISRNVSDTVSGFKSGGRQGAIQAGAESVFKNLWDPIVATAEHFAGRVMHPIKSLEEDPVGMAADVASIAIPALALARSGSFVNAAKSAIKAPAGSKISAAKEAFKTKPSAPPPVPPEVISESNIRPVEPGTVKSGPVAQDVKSKSTVRVEGTKPILDKSKRTAPPPPPPKVQKQLPAASKPRFTAGESGVADNQAPFNPVEAEIIEPPVVKPVKGQIAAPPKPRFTAGESGILDAESMPVPVEKPVPQIAGPKPVGQIEAPPAQKQLPAPGQSQIDHAKIATEVNSDTQIVANLDKLDNTQLTDIISQYAKDPSVDFASPTFDPGAYEQARRIRNTAQAVMRERAASGVSIGTDKPLAYTPDTPVPQTKIVGGEEVPVVEPKSAVAISSKEVAKPAPVSKPVSKPVSSETVKIEEPVAPPIATEPLIQPPTVSRSAPKTSTAPKPKTAATKVEKAAPPIKAEVVKPAATVQAKAEPVATVQSPIPTKLEQPVVTPKPVVESRPGPVNPKIPETSRAPKPLAKKYQEQISGFDADAAISELARKAGKSGKSGTKDKLLSKATRIAKTGKPNPESAKVKKTVDPKGKWRLEQHGDEPGTVYAYGKDGKLTGSIEVIRGKDSLKMRVFDSKDKVVGTREVNSMNESTFKTVATEYGIIGKN